jgi:hypothetical protein
VEDIKPLVDVLGKIDVTLYSLMEEARRNVVVTGTLASGLLDVSSELQRVRELLQIFVLSESTLISRGLLEESVEVLCTRLVKQERELNTLRARTVEAKSKS